MGASGAARGSFQVVVRLLWSTKKGQPVCGSTRTSQPGGSGSRSRSPWPLPGAICICTTGEWVAALMPGRAAGPGWRAGARRWRGWVGMGPEREREGDPRETSHSLGRARPSGHLYESKRAGADVAGEGWKRLEIASPAAKGEGGEPGREQLAA